MKPNMQFAQLAHEEAVQRAATALKNNGINVYRVDSGTAAKEQVVNLIPTGAQIMTMTSVTLQTLGLTQEIDESGNYNSIRQKLNQLDPSQADEKRQLAAAPDWVIGSVHAITEDGTVYIASNTGSQLATEVYTAGQAVFVVGTQKIVKDDAEAMQRIYEYCLPLEDKRAQAAYGTGSYVSKILIIKREVNPKRLHLILVPEQLGF